jgi:hypothetical protein
MMTYLLLDQECYRHFWMQILIPPYQSRAEPYSHPYHPVSIEGFHTLNSDHKVFTNKAEQC